MSSCPLPESRDPGNNIQGTQAHLCTVPFGVVRPHKGTLLLAGMKAAIGLGWQQPLRAFLSGQGELKQRPQPQTKVRTPGTQAGHRRIRAVLGRAHRGQGMPSGGSTHHSRDVLVRSQTGCVVPGSPRGTRGDKEGQGGSFASKADPLP